MYRLSDVLAHFKGVCVFLKTVVQHASCQKEETIYYPCKVCKNDVMFKYREVVYEYLIQSGFMDNYFICTKHGETQLGTESIIDERKKENMGIPDDVCSHHDGGCEDDIGQDDADHNDKGFDVEELTRLMCCYKEEIMVSIILRCLIKRRETFFMRSVKCVIRSTWCCRWCLS
jgi:hypothetical protein